MFCADLDDKLPVDNYRYGQGEGEHSKYGTEATKDFTEKCLKKTWWVCKDLTDILTSGLTSYPTVVIVIRPHQKHSGKVQVVLTLM